MLSHLSRAQEYLLLSLPFLLISGSMLPDLALSLVCIFFLIQSYIKREIKLIKLDIFGKIFFIWCSYLIVLSIFSDDPYLSLESSLFFFRFGVFTYAVMYLIKNNSRFILKFYYFLLFAILFVLIDGYIQYFFGKNIIGISYDGFRLSLLDGSKFFGHYLARLVPLLLAIAIFFFPRSYFHIGIMMFVLLASDIVIFLSGERTSFFILTAFTIAVLLLISKWKIVRLITIIFSGIIIFFIVNTSNLIQQRMVIQTLNQTNWGVTFSPEHDLLYESAINMFLDNKVFGVGPKIYRLKCSDEKYAKDSFGYRDVITEWDEEKSCSTHPHNMYIQLLAETGIIGTIPLIILFFYIFTKLCKHFYGIIVRRKYLYSDYAICLLVSIFVQLWPIMPHLSVFSNRVNVYIFLTIGFMMAYKYVRK